MAPLNILSLNVNGLNSPNKRVKAFQTFASLKASIVALQETHFTNRNTSKFYSSQYPQVFTASAATKQRGVLLAFHHTLPFTPISEIKDPEGRYIVLVGLLQDIETTFVSYYAPNTNSNPFFSHPLQIIKTHCKGTLAGTLFPLCPASQATSPGFPYQHLEGMQTLKEKLHVIFLLTQILL